jgi:outer membrane protein OmpA-like peptidoglycan-associated protein
MDYNQADSIEVIKHQIKSEILPEIKDHTFNREAMISTIREKVEEEISDTSSVADQLIEELTDELLSTVPDSGSYEIVEETIEMIPIRAGTVIRLNNIFFEANKADLKPESTASLDELATFLLENKNIYVEIGGHTNGLPGDEFCQKLSDNRAKAVTDYLIAKGIRSDHVSWKGYGKTQPVASNDTVEGRRKNQRVELKIIKVE